VVVLLSIWLLVAGALPCVFDHVVCVPCNNEHGCVLVALRYDSGPSVQTKGSKFPEQCNQGAAVLNQL
jgi:hypothetical protein